MQNEMQNFNSASEARSESVPRKKTSTPQKSRRSLGSRDEFCSLTDYQSNATTLSLKIKDHFMQVVQVVSDLLDRGPDSHCNSDIWACYETMFFLQTFTEIEKLYVCAYDGDAKLLQMLLPSANPRNMKLRGEWIVDILDPSQSGAPGGDETDGPVPSTREVGVQTNRNVGIQTDPTSSDEELVLQTRVSTRRKHAQARKHPGNSQVVTDKGVRVLLHQKDNTQEQKDKTVERRPQRLTEQNAEQGPRSVRSSNEKLAGHAEAKDLSQERKSPLPDIIDSSLGASHREETRSSIRTPRDDPKGTGQTDRPRRDNDHYDRTQSARSQSLLRDMASLYPFLSTVDTEQGDEQSSHSSDTDGKVQVASQNIEDAATSQEQPAGFLGMFNESYRFLDMVLKEKLPLMRLHWLVKCLQALSNTVEKEVALATQNDRSVGNDDLLPSLILFLIKGDPGKVTALYPQLKFLEDYLPDFIAAGISGFTVAQFSTAYAVIIETDDVST